MELPQYIPVLIVGAGPIGLACAISAKRRGMEHLVVDAGAIANSIVRYPIGMVFFTTPERLEIGDHPLVTSGPKASREEALTYYRGVVRAERLAVRPYVTLVDVRREGDLLHCQLKTRSSDALVRCERLILATGYFDHANMLDIPGETLPHVTHWFDEPHRTAGLDVVVIGGKNSAIETALQCFRAGARVTLVYRGAEFRPTVKYWLRPDIENRIKNGEIAVRMGTAVREITPTSVIIENPAAGREALPADRVYALTGYHPDFALLERIGIAIDAASGRPALDPESFETNVRGVHLAGSVGAGRNISEVFIENGRFDGEKIFGDEASRRRAEERLAVAPRVVGE